MIKQIQIAIATRMYKNAQARYAKKRSITNLDEMLRCKTRLFDLTNPHAIPSAW